MYRVLAFHHNFSTVLVITINNFFKKPSFMLQATPYLGLAPIFCIFDDVPYLGHNEGFKVCLSNRKFS